MLPNITQRGVCHDGCSCEVRCIQGALETLNFSVHNTNAAYFGASCIMKKKTQTLYVLNYILLKSHS